MTDIKMQAIFLEQSGDASKMQYKELPVPTPDVDEVLVAVGAAGVNFIDIYIRTGLYAKPLPLVLGVEGAGVVVAVGNKVTRVKTGDRVAWFEALGSYSSHAVVKQDKLALLPDALSFEQGAAALLQGLTARYLTRDTYPLKADDICLVHAAAGGVGLLLCQMAKKLGAYVIGTVSTTEKAQLAHQAGADEVILYTQQDVTQEVARITQDKGVHVVYDAVGADTFESSLACLKKRGLLVSYGQASGAIPPFDLLKLSPKSLFITRTSLFQYVPDYETLTKCANELFGWITAGEIKLSIDHILPLAQAAEAHRMLEGRKTTGKILLIP